MSGGEDHGVALGTAGIKAGQSMTLQTTVDRTIMLTPKRKFSLANLLAQCDLKAAPPADLAQWDAARPVGQEVW